MATIYNWNPFGVALDIAASAGTVTRTSATQFTVAVAASWETYYSGAKTNYGMTATSGGQTATLNAFGTNASSGAKSFTGTYSISGNGAQTKTITVTFRNFNNDNGDSATKNVTFSVSVPAWTSYTVTYNANGGSGAPSAQTKWKGQTLTLSTTKPTRTGYSFLGWSTSSSATSATYSAGGSYTADSAATLYAVWKANTYTVTYNANGGSGAPSSQTKTYGKALTLSSTKPTRSKYNFLGWGTSASAKTATYAAGGSYTTNASVTLYAVWEVAYQNPTLTNIVVERCDSSGNPSDSGKYGKAHFDWSTWENVTSVTIAWTPTDGQTSSTTVSASGTSGTVNAVFGNGALSEESSYEVVITVSDGAGNSVIKRTITGLNLPIDILSGDRGIGVSIGKPAEKDGVFEVALDNEFLGTTMQAGNRYSYSTTGVSGESGYIRMASIAITSTSANWPITFVFNRRKALAPMRVHVTLENSTASDSTLATFVYEGDNYGAFLVQNQPLVWDLYVTKANANDTITLQDWYTSTNQDKRMTVTFPGDMVTTVPTPYHRAIPAQVRSILDFIYPVGSIYICYSHADPASMFGGTWVRIENAFLWGVDSSGTIGQTGGEKTHTLTVNELPAHTHGSVYSQNATGTKNLPWYSGSGDKLAYGTVSTGGGAAHNNMPPYIQVSIWRRTA